MKPLLPLALALLISSLATAQKYEWLTTGQTGDSPQRTAPVATDPFGNSYLMVQTTPAGITIQGTAYPTYSGLHSVLVAKFDAVGDLVWGKMISAEGPVNSAEKIAVDAEGSVILALNATGTETITDDTTYQNTGGPQVIKLSTNGSFLRTAFYTASPRIGTCGTDVYVGARVNGLAAVQKLDSLFQVKWTVSATSDQLVITANGLIRPDLFVSEEGELVFSCLEAGDNPNGPAPFGNGVIPFTASEGGPDEIAVVRMDTTGQVLWAHTLMYPQNQYHDPRSVAIDQEGGTYVATFGAQDNPISFAGGTVDNPANEPYGAIFKWDAAGNEVWARGVYLTWGNGFLLSDMAVNAQNDVLVAGYGGNFSFNGDTTVTDVSPGRLFLLKCDASGTFQWVKRPDAPDGGQYADGVAVKNSDHYILGGGLQWADFGSPTYVFGCHSQPWSGGSCFHFITEISEDPECYMAIHEQTDSQDGLIITTEPGQNAFTVKLPGDPRPAMFEVVDISGRSILSTQSATGSVRLGMQGFAAGSYLFIALDGTERFTRNVLVE